MKSKRTCVVSRRALRRRSFIYFLFFFAVTCACLVIAPESFHSLNARWLVCRCDTSLSWSSFTLHTSTQRYWQSVREAEENVNKSLLLFSSLLFLILVILAHWRQLANQKYMNRKKKLDTKQQKCNQVKWAYFELSCTSLLLADEKKIKEKGKKEEVRLDCSSWQRTPPLHSVGWQQCSCSDGSNRKSTTQKKKRRNYTFAQARKAPATTLSNRGKAQPRALHHFSFFF